MPTTRRYTPEKPKEEISVFGMDYSFIIPKGVGIASAELGIFTNTVPPVPADEDWDVLSPVKWRDRTVYATLGGGAHGTDYLLRWWVTDTDGNVWPRVAAVLVTHTS